MINKYVKGKFVASIVMLSAWLLMTILYIVLRVISAGVIKYVVGLDFVLLYGFLIAAPIAVMAFLNQAKLNIPWLRLILIPPALVTLVYAIIGIILMTKVSEILHYVVGGTYSGGKGASAESIITILLGIFFIIVSLAYVAFYILTIVIPLHTVTKKFCSALWITSICVFGVALIAEIILMVISLSAQSSSSGFSYGDASYELSSSNEVGSTVGLFLLIIFFVASLAISVLFILRVLKNYIEVQRLLPFKGFLSGRGGYIQGGYQGQQTPQQTPKKGSHIYAPSQGQGTQSVGNSQPGGIQGVSGSYSNIRFPIDDRRTAVVGRDAASANIVVSDAEGKISRAHVQISYDARSRSYTVTDLSTNGTFVSGGGRLTPNVPARLAAGSVIYFYSTANSFKLL